MAMMESLNEYLIIDDAEVARLREVAARYQRLYDDPEHCTPMFIVNTPVPDLPDWEERLADPLLMLRAELDGIRTHLAMGDDRLPTVRVQFGTAQVAAAFGCELAIPTNSMPAAATHVISDLAQLADFPLPALTAGWYGKLQEWTALWQQQLPAHVQIQHPDIQSPFNNAHLIRGNDILTDFYDDPEGVGRLLDLVTDYMIALVPWLKGMISTDGEWFTDFGALWKGTARMSNCSMHMISPTLYREHVLPRDKRLLEAIGGGRIHYCGTAGEVIRDFFTIPGLSGLDCDLQYHDLWALAENAPAQATLMHDIAMGSATWQRLLAGDWPRKRNLILQCWAPSVEAGTAWLNDLNCAMPYKD